MNKNSAFKVALVLITGFLFTNDTISQGVMCLLCVATIIGTEGDNKLWGSKGSDVIAVLGKVAG